MSCFLTVYVTSAISIQKKKMRWKPSLKFKHPAPFSSISKTAAQQRWPVDKLISPLALYPGAAWLLVKATLPDVVSARLTLQLRHQQRREDLCDVFSESDLCVRLNSVHEKGLTVFALYFLPIYLHFFSFHLVAMNNSEHKKA